MLKKTATSIFISLAIFLPLSASALSMPISSDDLANMAGINAPAYVVTDAQSGQVLLSKNSQQQRIPASLTKLITALVVLDTKPKLSKQVTMTSLDQAVGLCRDRGVCIKSKAGVKFTVDGLFHAALILSANNAASALARSTGLSESAFAALMNKKAASLGATHSHFAEPTGLNPGNIITAEDYAKILAAAYNNPYLSGIAGMGNYTLLSTNNSRYNQDIHNVDKLLADADVEILGAKTGYLDESLYNFASVLKLRGGRELAIVVLGENHLYVAYQETKKLAELAEAARTLSWISGGIPQVLGTTTSLSINN